MSTDVHVTELVAAYALGCLEEEEARQVAEHIAACADCRAELAACEAVVGRLALAAPEATPPAGLKQRLLAQIEPTRRSVEVRQPWWEAVNALFRRNAPAWAMASLLLVIALIASNVLWLRARRSPLLPNGMHVIALTSTGAAPGASGSIVVSPDGEYGTLVVAGLPALDREHQYQLWLVRNGDRTSGGVLSIDSHGYGAMVVYTSQPLSHYDSFGITVEPAGGSPGPTGPKVLGGSSL
jgi:anti-sigma-K factor RskA